MKETNYLTAIISGDRSSLTQMYTALFPVIRRMVRDFGGSEADAKDVFQDAVVVLYEKAQNPGFQLTSKFSTLFYGVCRYLWIARRQKKSASEVTIPGDAIFIPDESAEIDLLLVERNKLFYKSLRQLGPDCQKLLQLFFEKWSMDEIAREMGFASEGYARRRKSQCKDRLVEIIKDDPRFAELQSD